MKTSFRLALVAGTVASATGLAMAQGTDFASATVLNIGSNNPTTVSGAVSSEVSTTTETSVALYENIFYDSALPTGAFNTVENLTAGAGFRTITSAPTDGSTSLDTRMRVRDSGGGLLGENDDSGAGSSFPFSGVAGTVPGDGILDIDASFWQDNDYGGEEGGPGSFNLEVFETQTVITDPGVTGQWWRFEGLTPGGQFSGNTIAGTLTDTVMAAFDSTGASLGSDDDGGTGFLSALSGVVPADGVVVVAVSGYHGGFNQPIQATQDYYTTGGDDDGDFGLRFVPAPGTFAILGLGGLAAARRRRA